MKQMVRDYETPTVPPAWETFTRHWAERVGLKANDVSLTCSPDRYGNAVVLRLIRPDGVRYIATRRSSNADDAAERRKRFLQAVRNQDYRTAELDVAGYFVGNAAIPCGILG